MGFKLSELFVEITAPLDKLESGLKEAHSRLEDAAASMGAAASVDLGRSMTSGLGTSLAGLGAVVGSSFATALVPLQAQVANLGHIMRASAVGSGGAFHRLEGQLNGVLHAMDNIVGRHFDKELSRQIKTVNSVVWKRWLQGVQIMRRLQNQSEFTRATIARTVGTINGLNPFRHLRSGEGGFGIPDVGKIYSARFANLIPPNPFAPKASQDREFAGSLPKVDGGGLGGSAIGLGPLAAAGVAGTAAIATGMAKAASVASDLNETVSKVGVTFGDSAKIVEGAADDMAKKFGVPKREMMDAVSIFGLMAKGAGQSERAAADFGVGLSKLAMDASSFYNVGLDVALDKIRSGLSGESEPLRAFGVFLTEDAVKAEAARMGLAKLGAELTEGQKIMARSSLIYKGLAEAQGDLERTQSGFANQSRELWGRLANLVASAGQALVPVLERIMAATNRLLSTFEGTFSGAAESGRWFADFMVDVGEKVTIVFSELENAILSVGKFFADEVARMVGGWENLSSAIKVVRDVFTEAMSTIGFMWRHFDLIVEQTTIRVKGYMANLGEIVSWLGASFRAFLDWFSANWKTIFFDAFESVKTALMNLGANFRDFGKAAYDSFTSWFTKPFEFKMTPILQGANLQTPGLKLPELALSSVGEAIQDMEDKIIARESKFQEEAKEVKKGKDAEANRKKVQRAIDAPMSKDKAKAEFVGIAEFAKRIQAGALDKDKIAKDHLNVAKKSHDLLDSIEKSVKKPPIAVAAGRK